MIAGLFFSIPPSQTWASLRQGLFKGVLGHGLIHIEAQVNWVYKLRFFPSQEPATPGFRPSLSRRLDFGQYNTP